VFEGFAELARERYTSALSINGDLGVEYPSFESHLKCIIERYCPERGCEKSDPVRFVRSLYTADLFLALACSHGSNAGWQRLSGLYRRYLAKLSRHLIRRGLDPEDLADAIWVDLFLPDRSGRSRIASYDGRSSLSTWLRVIVSNRVVNERLRKSSHLIDLNGIPEPADLDALNEMETRLRLNRYGSTILECFRRVSLRLSARDCLILLLRYDQELQLGEIARLFSVHQSTITRQMDRALAKLRSDLLNSLASEYGLGPDAVRECLSVAGELLSSVSIMSLLKSVVKSEPLQPGPTRSPLPSRSCGVATRLFCHPIKKDLLAP
jgi:RNA polymerase sigma-70 factor